MRCESISSVLDEANECFKFLLVLIVEESLPHTLRWLGIIEEVNCSGWQSRFQICNVREAAQLGLEEPLSGGATWVTPALSLQPYVISTPTNTRDYLSSYEMWLRDKYNPFFNEHCLFLPVEVESLRSLPFDANGVQTVEITSTFSAPLALFENVVAVGKVLNIIFGDRNKNLAIVGIAVVDSIVSNGKKIDIGFVCADEFLDLHRSIPVSTLHLSEGAVMNDVIRDRGYAICESPWYVSLYLDRVFCSPTASEFAHALINVRITLEERTMLWRHAASANRTLSMHDLAQFMKYKDAAVAYLRYSMLAARIAEFVAFPSEYFDDGLNCLAIRADLPGSYEEEGWKMRPELASALVLLGWVSMRGEKYELSRSDIAKNDNTRSAP